MKKCKYHSLAGTIQIVKNNYRCISCYNSYDKDKFLFDFARTLQQNEIIFIIAFLPEPDVISNVICHVLVNEKVYFAVARQVYENTHSLKTAHARKQNSLA